MNIKSFGEVEPILGNSAPAFIELLGYIRTHYAMDELWDGRDELKFRRSGKTLVTFYVHDGYFTVLMIYGKQERLAFEEKQDEFPSDIQDYYKNSKTYHDGKWMFMDIRDTEHIDSLIRMLNIKKKPNRKKENLSNAILGKCGNRCDLCLLHESHSAPENKILFKQGDRKCYHTDAEPEVDYSGHQCGGCHNGCEVVKCTQSYGYQSCIECDYKHCNIHASNFTNPGRCNLGLTHQDVEQFVLPYCGRERFQVMKNK